MSTHTAVSDGRTLLDAWSALREEEPKLRIRDAATRLGASEAQLLVAQQVAEGGDTPAPVSISPDVLTLLPRLEALGDLMALTRNDVFVHERTGVYENVSGNSHAAQVVGHEVDLRIFPAYWCFGFAVETPSRGAPLRSLQFFDAHGDAVHKIYAREGTDLEAYHALVEDLRVEAPEGPGGPGTLPVEPRPAPAADRPDGEIDVAALEQGWRGMRDTHDFFHLLRAGKVGRVQALRLVDEELARPTDGEALRRVLEGASEREVPIMIFVRSPGTFQIHHGLIHRVVDANGWLNVLDPRFNLHVRADRIAQSWIVRKPTETGWVTSLELYDENAQLLALLFGEREEGEPEREAWQALLS